MFKLNNLLAAVAVLFAASSLTACGESAGAVAGSKFFGDVPALYLQMMEKKADIKEQFKNASSEGEAKDLMTQAQQFEDDYRVQIQNAASDLTGKTIEVVSTDDFTVNTPLTMTFDGFFSKSDMTPQLKFTGEVVAARDYQSDDAKGITDAGGDLSRYVGLAQHIYLEGYDDQGNQVFSSQVGYAPLGLSGDGQLLVKTGTPVKFDNLTINKKNAEGCLKATSLRLVYSKK